MFEDPTNNLPTLRKIKKYFLAYFSTRLVIQVTVFLFGLAISSFGLLQLFNNSVSASGDGVSNSVSQVCTKDPEFGRLTVDIGGAVKNPGVYELKVGARINDLVNTAGGFSHNVDKHYINKILNLSQRVSDGEKFYIPTLQDSIEAQENQQAIESGSSGVGQSSSQAGGSSGGSGSATGSTTNFISINSASKEALMSLVGIGEKRAGDIIAQRPYDSVGQLIEREVISQNLFDDIKNSISL